MITHAQKYELHENGIQVDIFGRRIKVGQTVLVKGYGSSDKDTFAVVKKVNKKSVIVDVDFTRTSHGAFSPRPDGHVGSWSYYPDRTYEEGFKEIRREGRFMLIIPDTFKNDAIQEGLDFMEEYPEYFI